ncbi:uncharacterized protein LOC105798838 isoform X1 [Gossypium raimondii]|uniref:uncharacterized protein LOC105798838 isoform X1 n=1 Tax=Gossypium raimondii TaxID=29730 RepID=UPI00227D1CFC|nr:uncharacterized protein LOC105798838 isoform X1 [Gossypium raimondii]
MAIFLLTDEEPNVDASFPVLGLVLLCRRTNLQILHQIKAKRTDKINGIVNIKAGVSYSTGGSPPLGSLLRRPSALLEDLRHRPRHPPQQTNRSRRYFTDNAGGSEISGVV